MKRTVILILALMLLLGMARIPITTEAATLSSKAGAVTTNSSALNVRSAPSTGAAIVATLRKGSYITLLSKSGGWWHVEFGNRQQGYCHGDYITVVEGAPVTVATQSGALNVRSGPGTTYGKVGSLAKGETVLRLTTSNGWSRILYHGIKTGYVSAQYLSGTVSGNSAVALQVPNYKQTDARWANVKIGSSGKTIAQIGCATTGIAMLESYRTGTNIHPDAMSRKLNYTSSGSVYWPANFIAVTDRTDYLGNVYRLLKQGKPVLLGAKNAYGSQHWVVITGFAGGNLTAANFTIHDPGSNSRTSLQQFLNVYPNFYKYFYYS